MPRAVVESTPEEEESDYEQDIRKANTSSNTRASARARANEGREESEAYGDEMDVDENADGELEEEDGEDEVEGDDGEDQIDVEAETEDKEDISEPEEAYSTPEPPRKGKGSSTPSRNAAAKSLKITLKLPHRSPRRPRTRVIESTDPSEPPSRDVESEDEVGPEDEDDDEVMPGPSGRSLTTRQAVLASVVDSSHVSLDDATPSRKKKQLNEAELALRREETARKRKHMSEKKLEDEKAETINRLLKKQSRPRNKRNALATADDRTPATQSNAAGTPDGDEDGGEAAEAPIEIPKMYRWISTSCSVVPPAGGEEQPSGERTMKLTFSIPLTALPDADANGPAGATMEVDPPSRKMTPHCVAPGCDRLSKYRLRSNFLQGVCGIEHLKLLESAPNIR